MFPVTAAAQVVINVGLAVATWSVMAWVFDDGQGWGLTFYYWFVGVLAITLSAFSGFGRQKRGERRFTETRRILGALGYSALASLVALPYHVLLGATYYADPNLIGVRDGAFLIDFDGLFVANPVDYLAGWLFGTLVTYVWLLPRSNRPVHSRDKASEISSTS